MENQRKAVVLLSGGLDSTTTAAIAKEAGFQIFALTFRYGQRHQAEIQAAARAAANLGVEEHVVANIDLRAFGGSALTDDNIDVPEGRSLAAMGEGIPVTYVPARNTIFLSFALGWAEVLEAGDIFVGVNALDYSGYPDCRPEFIRAYEQMANLDTRAGVEGTRPVTIHTPLLQLSKAEIIARGLELGVDYSETVSCYQAGDDGTACGRCDSCLLRIRGFQQNRITDPAPYVTAAP